MKGRVSFLHAVLMRQCTYSATPVKVQSGIHNWLGWSKSGQGKTRWFESCPCRSSEGARDLFYIKAKIVEGLAWKSDPRPSDFDLLSPCHSQSGLLSFPKWLYRFPPDFCQALKKKRSYLPYDLIVLHIEGGKSTMSTLASLPSVHHKRGECTLIQSIQIRT